VVKECRVKTQLNNAEPREERQKARRSSPPEQTLMTATPIKGGFTCEEAYDLITDIEQES